MSRSGLASLTSVVKGVASGLIARRLTHTLFKPARSSLSGSCSLSRPWALLANNALSRFKVRLMCLGAPKLAGRGPSMSGRAGPGRPAEHFQPRLRG